MVDRWKCGGWIGRRSTWCIARVIRGSAEVVGDDCGGLCEVDAKYGETHTSSSGVIGSVCGD